MDEEIQRERLANKRHQWLEVRASVLVVVAAVNVAREEE